MIYHFKQDSALCHASKYIGRGLCLSCGAIFKMPDKIFIQELKIPCLIGIFDWERKKKQTVSVSLEFPADISKASKTDDIRNAVDYKKIAKRTIAFVSQSKFYLIEALIEELAQLLLKEFRLKEITLQIEKPGAIRGASTVGIKITRSFRKTRKNA